MEKILINLQKKIIIIITEDFHTKHVALIKNLRSKKDDANKLYFLSQTFEGERTTANKGREKMQDRKSVV